jgi:hypothetical protein
MFRKKEPRKEDKTLNWDHEKVEKGKFFNAWIAGEMVGVLCHWSYRSIPCYYELTDGKLGCPHCQTKPILHWCGYLPLYRDTHRPTVVVIREVSRRSVELLKTHAAVRVAREEKDGSAITVVPSKWANSFSPPKDFSGPPDIRRWLLRFWKEKDLEAFVLANPVLDGAAPSSDPPVPPDTDRAAKIAAFFDRDEEKMRRYHEAEKRAAERNQIPPTVIDSLQPLNGTHRKKS